VLMRLADLGDKIRWVAVLAVCRLARGGGPLGEGVAAQGVLAEMCQTRSLQPREGRRPSRRGGCRPGRPGGNESDSFLAASRGAATL
jgi:hypothetical protein